ncbi:MAG: DoxX family protein [Candidatus Eisenbacteria bacterium]|uniref:DoxX family protein n=1 Tax=Eiseniibacteriota bacterium TaxID=2212470 RepID=A0A849SM25_UNCEI|nr:DoxX family protein [Candidatus Eisenbacteria bacterium]
MLNQSKQLTHALLRIVTGVLFACHGGQKLFGWFGGFGGVPGNTVEFMTLMGFAGILELFGGLALLVGGLTRPVALLLSGEMAVAYFMAHQREGLLPIQNHGELAVLYCFLFLYFAAHGAGALSVDRVLKGHSVAELFEAPHEGAVPRPAERRAR